MKYLLAASLCLLSFISSANSEELNRKAPDFTLKSNSGENIRLNELKGNVVLVNFWATWCGPCRKEASGLNRLAGHLADEPVRNLGLNSEGLPPERLAQVAGEWGLVYPVGVGDRSREGTPLAGERVVPHTWLIDTEGRIRASRSGYVPAAVLERAVRRLLDETHS